MRKKEIISLIACATLVASPAINTFATVDQAQVVNKPPISTEVKSTEIQLAPLQKM